MITRDCENTDQSRHHRLRRLKLWFAKVVLPPGTSVGWHQHVHDTEPYYILKGQADFIDNDKSVTKVGPGDCCIIQVGQFHSLENNSDEDVEFMALIYNEPGFLYE